VNVPGKKIDKQKTSDWCENWKLFMQPWLTLEKLFFISPKYLAPNGQFLWIRTNFLRSYKWILNWKWRIFLATIFHTCKTRNFVSTIQMSLELSKVSSGRGWGCMCGEMWGRKAHNHMAHRQAENKLV
jgi:hypothetical protein